MQKVDETKLSDKDLKKLGRRRLVLVLAVIALITTVCAAPFMLSKESSVPASSAGYSFGAENVITGTTVDTSNRDVEDGLYEQLIEEDTYTDTNFSGSSEDVVLGTGGGGSFPTALDTDDTTRRSYTEENTAEAPPDPYSVYLFPNGDSSVGWDAVYPADGVHYTKVDETTVGGDGATTYVETSTNSDEDRFNMADLGDPGAGYNIDVTVFAVHYKGASQPNSFAAGIRIGTTNYEGISVSPTNGAYVNSSSTAWTLNPSTTSEWTFGEVDALLSYITTSDASPTVRCTQVGLKVDVTFSGGSANYELDAQITYSSVTSTAQTTGYTVLCQGYRTDSSENYLVQAFNYTSSAWVTKTTINVASDGDFNFALLGWATNCERSSGNEVKIRILGGTESSDTTQNVVYLDVLKVSRIEQGYALEIEMTASSVNEYGEEQLKVKGYSSSAGESFAVHIWNWTSSSYDTDKITVSATSNTLYTYNLITEHHRSETEQVKVAFDDSVAAASDLTKDTCYLDLLEVTWVHTDPEVSAADDSGPTNYGESLSFWMTYSDTDDEAPTYVRLCIDLEDPVDCIANDSEDLTYWDSKDYYYTTSSLDAGTHNYYFAIKDANSGEVTTVTAQVTVNAEPELSGDGVDPVSGQGSNGDTFSFYIVFTDADGDLPSYLQVVIDSTPYDCSENSSGDTDTEDGKAYFYEKAMTGGPHTYHFQTADYLSSQVTTSSEDLDVNNKPTLSDFDRTGDPCYPTTEVTFSVTFTDLDGDFPSSIKWRESTGSIQNVSMVPADADADTTDGKLYELSIYLSHGNHEYDFYATDGVPGSHVIGGSSSITIQNRAPTIDNTPSSTTTYRSTYWSWNVDATDLDDDTIVFESWDNCTFALTIDEDTGLLEGTTDTNLGWYDIWVWANDSYSGSDYYNFQLTVINRAPSITSAGNTTQGIASFMAYHVTYSDADGDECDLEFATNCTDLSLSNEWVNGTVTSAGWYWLKLWCNDSFGGSDLEEWQLTVSNTDPYFTSTPIYSVSNNTFYSYDANASDPDPGATLTYGLESDCAELEVDEDLGYVNGTPVLVGSYFVNVTCSDGEGGLAWSNYTLEVLNDPPEWTSSPITTGELGVPYLYDANATDLNGDELLYSKYEGPTWLFVDESTGEVAGTPTSTGSFSVKIRAFDGYVFLWSNYTLEISGDEEPPEEEEPDEVPPLPPGPPPIYDDEPLLEPDTTLVYGVMAAGAIALVSVILAVVITRRKHKKTRKKK